MWDNAAWERERRKPTRTQLDFARWLIQRTESDPDWYELKRMTRRQVQDVIDRLSVGVDASGWEDER